MIRPLLPYFFGIVGSVAVVVWFYSPTGKFEIGPSSLEVNAGSEEQSIIIMASNSKSGSVQIVGYNSSCECLSSESFPLTIDPYSKRELKFVLAGSSQVERNLLVKFYLSGQGETEQSVEIVVSAPLTGNIVKPNQGEKM